MSKRNKKVQPARKKIYLGFSRPFLHRWKIMSKKNKIRPNIQKKSQTTVIPPLKCLLHVAAPTIMNHKRQPAQNKIYFGFSRYFLLRWPTSMRNQRRQNARNKSNINRPPPELLLPTAAPNMKNQMGHSAQNKGGRRRLNSNDLISQMPDDILVTILNLLPIKDAVVTGSLSTRWKLLWGNVNSLNFDMGCGAFVTDPENYIKQVNSVIRSYNHPVVHDFRICHDLTSRNKRDIDKWLQFAVNKKVKFLQLDLMGRWYASYEFPVRLSERNILHLGKGPSSNATLVELVSLKHLILKNVNVREKILNEFLTKSPCLESISIHRSNYLKHIRVGGRILNLKHLEIVECCSVRSIYLSDFDLVSFTYKSSGIYSDHQSFTNDVSRIDLRLSHLPKLKEIDIGQGLVELNNNFFGQISSCASFLQSLSINLYCPQMSLLLHSFPELPNLKKLRLAIGGSKGNYLLDLASIVNACPSLETFTITQFWTQPIINKRKARNATYPHQHLKLVEIMGYYGRNCDFELAAYIIHTAIALKKISINPRFQGGMLRSVAAMAFSQDMEAARSSIEQQLGPILPQGVELGIL